MRLSCLPVSLYAGGPAGQPALDKWFLLARTLDLDGADLSVAQLPSRSSQALDAVRRQAEDCGIPIVMLASYTDFTHPAQPERLRQQDDLREWIDAAARLNARFLRATAGQAHAGVEEDPGLAWATEGLTSGLDHAAQAGIRLLYENHVRGIVWTANDFTQPAARFLEVVRRTAGSGLELLFDTANLSALGEDTLAVLDAVRDRIGAIHMSDIRRRGTFEPTVIGTGVAPIQEVLQRMVEGGFDGWISIEEASRTGEDAFGGAVAFADKVWREAGGQPRRRPSSAADGP
jgi:sugar phosphate isomerase/epimerase